MDAAIDGGGFAVGVLADSLVKMTQGRETRSFLADEQLTLLTPFAPEARFNVGNAMSRNRLIYCLSEATVVVSTASGKGGTWVGATENLKAGWVPLWVWRSSNSPAGNDGLLALGGKALDSDLVPGQLLATLRAPNDSTRSARPIDAGSDIPVAQVRDLFELSWPAIAAYLTDARSEADVAAHFELQLTQARSWLQRAVDTGRAMRQTRPIRYRTVGGDDSGLGQPTLFDNA